MNATATPSATPSATSGRSPRLLLLPALMSAALFIASSATVRAASIGVSFAPVASGHLLPPGASAGVTPQTNWQNITATPISGVILNDNNGAATTAALSASAPGGFVGFGNYTPSAVVGDEWLMETNLAASGTMSFTIASIPYAAYDLIVYNLPLFSNVLYTYTVGATSYFGRSPAVSPTSAGYVDNNGGTPFTFTQATSTSSGSPTLNSTYTRFDGLTGSSVTFSVTGGNGIAYTNGFQLVEVIPEPSRAVLLLGGLLAIFGRRARRRL